MPREPLSESFGFQGSALLCFRVALHGKPYVHSCSLQTFEDVCHAIEDAGGAGFTTFELAKSIGRPCSQVNVAVSFLKERGIALYSRKRLYAAGPGTHLDGLVEWHALRVAPPPPLEAVTP